jgi:hypothetical protein
VCQAWSVVSSHNHLWKLLYDFDFRTEKKTVNFGKGWKKKMLKYQELSKQKGFKPYKEQYRGNVRFNVMKVSNTLINRRISADANKA